jgi:hypothetical protein
MIQLPRYRSDSILSCYDNQIEDDENLWKVSKWSIVRQRLPDILALSPTYKPSSIRAQLILLIALMTRQSNQSDQLSISDSLHNPLLIPASVMVNIGNRNRIIKLKRIPPDQMIHVDIDGLTFSIPTRQFIIAISRGDAHETAAKYCPPAISDMLIDLSKTKVVDDGKQYRRALFKMRLGKTLFLSLFIFISAMFLALFVSTTTTVLKLNSLNYTSPKTSITSLSSLSSSSLTNAETDEYLNS